MNEFMDWLFSDWHWVTPAFWVLLIIMWAYSSYVNYLQHQNARRFKAIMDKHKGKKPDGFLAINNFMNKKRIEG